MKNFESNNKYEDMSALKALNLANEHYLLLPDIQRDYVWDTSDIEKLFESIVDGYPIGSCIFWKTDKKTLNKESPNLYYFIREFCQDKTKNEKSPEVFSGDGDYYIVLDGQQRITSMNLALFGSYTKFRGGRGNAKSKKNNWLKRELYYNLNYYDEIQLADSEDEEIPKRFCFLTDEEAKNSDFKFYKVSKLLTFDNSRMLIKDLMGKDYSDEIQEDLETLFNRLNSASNDGLIHYYCISENSYDEALDIFVRVNLTGKKLSKSDLLFSTLIDGWKTGKENIEALLTSINGDYGLFKFSKDYLMRLMLILVDAPTNLKIENFNSKTVNKIRDNWSKIEKSVEKMSDVLKQIGMSDAYLTSYNATMPIAYYIYNGGEFKTQESKQELKKYLSISMANRLFGVASNNALSQTRKVLQGIDCKKTDFKLSLFNNIILTGNRTFTVEDKDIDIWLDKYEIGQNTYTILSLLYPDLNLDQTSFHQDHCHPYSGFEKKNLSVLNLSDEKIEEWQFKRNLLPNLQFLERSKNESKNNTPLKDWIQSGNKIEYMPSNVSLELKDFDKFFEERRKLLKNELKNVFEI